MTTLNALSFRAASLLAAVSISLVTAYGQATYSSPVKVTNTPLPITASSPLDVSGSVLVSSQSTTHPVYVAPAAATLPVSAPSPLDVSGSVLVSSQSTAHPVYVTPATATLPVSGTVSVGGTVTVTPSGGDMPVSGSVTIHGTPTVSLSETGNTVSLAGTPFTRREILTLNPGLAGLSTLLFTESAMLEIETTSVFCQLGSGDKLLRVTVGPDGSGTFDALMTFTGHHSLDDYDYWVGSGPGKYYIPAGTAVRVGVYRSPAALTAYCYFSFPGRSY